MKHELLRDAAALIGERRRKRLWKCVISCLAVMVILATAYALMMPAITLEDKTLNGVNIQSNEEKTLICDNEDEDHVHTEDCYGDEREPDDSERDAGLDAKAKPSADREKTTSEDVPNDRTAAVKEDDGGERFVLEADCGAYRFKVTYGADAKIPADAKLTVYEYSVDSDEYGSQYERLVRTLKDERAKTGGAQEREVIDPAFARFFDVSFVAGGREIEPEAEVNVEITAVASAELPRDGSFGVVHYGQAEELIAASNSRTQDGESVIGFTLDSFSDIALYATRDSVNVYVDGTNGGLYYYQGATNTTHSVSRYSNFTLPTANNVSTPNKYPYKLNGWYDIINNRWYAPGASVRIDAPTIFYADWIAASYDIGQNVNTVECADTESFITTKLYDYNDLFNVRDLHKTATRLTWNTTTESWQVVTSGTSDTGQTPRRFILIDGRQHNNSILKPGGRPENNGAYVNREVNYGPYPGIVTPGLYNRATDLFDESTLGVHYVGEGDYLFQYDNNPASQNYGYYYYDSVKNAAAYNQSQSRFYVYNYTEKTDVASSANDFLPFNYGHPVYDCGDGSSAGGTHPQDANYFFGMKTEIQFFLPDNSATSGSGTLNQAVGGKDMIYHFTGDDDVWVFVDDELVLDLGGIHHMVYGEINFSNGRVTIRDNGNSSRTTTRSFAAGDHKLTIYYMERGASQSNCSIYFNIAPRRDIEIFKGDPNNPGQQLNGAVFAVFQDEDCTIPAPLQDANGNPTNTFTVTNGRAYIYGFYNNKTYYIKEIQPPPDYPSVSDKVIAVRFTLRDGVQVNVLPDNTLPGSPGYQAVYVPPNGISMKPSGTGANIHVNNTKPQEVSVTAEKVWLDESGNPLADPPESIGVKLYRSTFYQSSSGENVSVNFSTAYFGGGNGSNTDHSWLSAGDYSYSTIVASGSTMTFTVKVKPDRVPYMGIYSVSVNGRRIEPISTGGRTSQNCLINGTWGNYPYVEATYRLTDITDVQNVRITYIGYLGYITGTGTPSVAASMEEIVPLVQEPQPSVEIPSTMPENAEEVEPGIIRYLNEGNGWRYTWLDLPFADDQGRPYYYYVQETDVPGYITVYSGNGITSGTVTIINQKEEIPEDMFVRVDVRKNWDDGANVHASDEVTFNLIRTGTDGSVVTVYENVPLSAANNWSVSWDRLPAKNSDRTVDYTYSVVETSNHPGYITQYSSSYGSTTAHVILVINNDRAYELPHTGGSGTIMYSLSGLALCTVALMYGYCLRRRKEEGRISR